MTGLSALILKKTSSTQHLKIDRHVLEEIILFSLKKRIASYLKESSYEFTRVTLGEDKIPQTRINKGFSGTNAGIPAHEHTALI